MAESAPVAKHSLAEFLSIWFCSLWVSYWLMWLIPSDLGWSGPIAIIFLFSFAGASLYVFRRWQQSLQRLIWVTLLGLLMATVNVAGAVGLLWYIVSKYGMG